jgi:hypothetical protein
MYLKHEATTWFRKAKPILGQAEIKHTIISATQEAEVGESW